MKRKTKEQRDAEAKIALRKRVADIAVGASGYDFDQDDEFATAEFLSRFVPALKVQFRFESGEGNERTSNDWLWHIHNLHYFNDIDSTTDFLFDNKVRA